VIGEPVAPPTEISSKLFTEVATGMYSGKLDAKIAEIKGQCGIP